jgi:REP element-mobilizing transposase RayT
MNISFLAVMSIHTPLKATGIYFITFTCHQWLQLIERVKGYDLVYRWFDILSVNGHAITAYVIMPNHLHLLLYYVGSGKSLNTIIGNGKRFMAYAIVDRPECRKEEGLLARLRSGVRVTDRKRGKKHEVWIDTFDVKQCRTEKFVLQKLNYIHNNPCAGKWKLADSIIQYPHSWALFYINGKMGNYPVKDYREFLRPDNY